jgi:hypothetical protein
MPLAFWAEWHYPVFVHENASIVFHMKPLVNEQGAIFLSPYNQAQTGL